MRNIFIIISLSLSLFACENANKTKSSQPASWSTQMQSLSASVQNLIPFVFSFNNFKPEDHKDELIEYITVFNEKATYLPSHVGEEVMGKDPIVRFSVNNLRSSTAQALSAVKSGHYSYARGVLKESLSTCFNCHTAQQIGPENLGAKNWMTTTPSNTAEKADYYIATRQYDNALKLLEQTLTKKSQFYESPYELSSALKRYLAIQVRVKKDSKKTLEVLNNFLKGSDIPFYLRNEANAWITALKQWNKKDVVSYNVAKRLVKNAEAKTQLDSGQGGLVEYLRASTIFHELLKSSLQPKRKADIYYELAKIYENLSDLGVWDLSEAYYIGCIETLPGSNLAKKCYSDLERSIVIGFSGSAGIMVPVQEREKLNKMKKLSEKK